MNCQECREHYYGYLTDAEKIPSGAVGHIAACENCRQQVERLRSQLNASQTPSEQSALLRRHLQLHARLLNQWVSCDQVRPFLPALLLHSMRVTVLTPVTAHIEHCARCREHLDAIKSLQLSQEQMLAAAAFMSAPAEANPLDEHARSAIQSILSAEASDIATRIDSGASSCLKVRHCRPAVKASSRSRSVRYLLTGSVAAAAVFLVIVLLPASAIGNLENVNKAVKSVSEVYLQRFSSNGNMIQEIWMSRSLGFKIYRQPQRTLVKNMRSGQIVRITPGSEPAYAYEGLREEDMYARLLPFDHIRDLPPNYEWTFVENSVFNGKDVYIYELAWQNTGTDMTVYKKWRAALDTQTYLPYRIEWFEKVGSEQDFILLTRSEVQYPSRLQFRQKLEHEGLQRLLTDDHME